MEALWCELWMKMRGHCGLGSSEVFPEAQIEWIDHLVLVAHSNLDEVNEDAIVIDMVFDRIIT